jgi:hypothetical protein
MKSNCRKLHRSEQNNHAEPDGDDAIRSVGRK